MLKNILIHQVKKHPVASLIYALYLVLWLAICYLLYHFLLLGDADRAENIVFYGVISSITYLMVNFWMSNYDKASQRYYKELNFFIAVPIGIVVLVYLVRAFVNYMNMGV